MGLAVERAEVAFHLIGIIKMTPYDSIKML